jgi:hypothetical protein
MLSVNASNESPASSSLSSPHLPIPFNPVAADLTNLTPNYVLVSPQTAVNILTTQPDLKKMVCAIAYGLVSTVHQWEVAHTLETKERDKTNRILQQCLKQYAEKVNRDFFLLGCPNGYEENQGRVSTQIPVEGGYFVNAKFVRLQDDGRALLLTGKEHNKDPCAIELYLMPDYSSTDFADPLPVWFNTLLNGPTPAYHTLHRAVATLNDWNAIAEIEHFWRTDDRLCSLWDKLALIQAEVHLIEDNLVACRYRIKATNLPSKIPNLEGHAWSEDYPSRRRTLGRGIHRGPGGPN